MHGKQSCVVSCVHQPAAAAAPGAAFSSAAAPRRVRPPGRPCLLMVNGAGDATTLPTPAAAAAAATAAPADCAPALPPVHARAPAVPGVLVAGVRSDARLPWDRRERPPVRAPVAGVVSRPAWLAGVCRPWGEGSRVQAEQCSRTVCQWMAAARRLMTQYL